MYGWLFVRFSHPNKDRANIKGQIDDVIYGTNDQIVASEL